MDFKEKFKRTSQLDQHFINLVLDLASRSSSVAADEPICIATLLGMSLEAFNSQPTMADICGSYHFIPEDVVFVQAPRLQIDGYGWAPSTLLKRSKQVFDPSTVRKGRVTSSRFYIKKNGIKLLHDFEYDNSPYNLYYIPS